MYSYETKRMTVSHEIKSQLAKLLATEDLVVEHRAVDTAQFNVHTRVLTLPQWEKASNIVYDMLVGHEVGHALFTPDVDPPRGIPHSFINIVEDARIEKLMKKKYPGLSKTFFGAYKELSDEDFFCLENEDISKMNLADRANLYYKIGAHIDIPFFNFDESRIIKMIADTETFDDVILVAEELYKICKKSKQEEKNDILVPTQGQGGGEYTGDSEQTDTDTDSTTDEGGSSEGGSGDENIKSNNGGTSFDDEPEVQTVDNLEEKLKELTSDYSQDTVYVEIPKLNLDTVIASNADVHKECDDKFALYQGDEYENCDSQFKVFKKSAQKEVSYLVKEFECKKSADSYARSSISRTGVLDCSKLHTYKYSEDLFKKVTTIPDGNNHGLIFILDWSGSMGNVLLDTIKQLYNLVWFCKKTSIPFEVYAFTGEWNRPSYDYETGRYNRVELVDHYEKKEYLLCVEEHFKLMNVLTSKVNAKQLEHQMINIWRIAYSYTYCVEYGIPDKVTLSGTPLNETLIALHSILPKFQKENKLQKVQTIILTDGEAGPLPYHKEVNRFDDYYMGTRRVPYNSFLRDRKLGTTYKLSGNTMSEYTDALLKNLRDKFESVNFIGIRVMAPRDAISFIRRYSDYGEEHHDEIIRDWSKNRSFCIKNSGYHAYFGMSANALSQDTEFTVKEDATKTQIKSAFIKSLRVKKLNKKVLGEFISLVA